MKKLTVLALFGFIAAFCAATIFVSSASADTVSYNVSIPSQLTDWSDVPLNFTEFNPSLGTLTGVTLNLSLTVSTYFTLTGTPGQAGSIKLPYYMNYPDLSPLNLPFKLTVTDSNGRITGGPQISTTLNPVASQGGGGFTYVNKTTGLGPYVYWTSTFPANGSLTTPTFTTTAAGVSDYTDPALLTELTGSGFTPLFADSLTSTFVSFGGATFGQTTHAAVDATITYQYTPVPVPGALLLFAPGLFGLVAIRRRFGK